MRVDAHFLIASSRCDDGDPKHRQRISVRPSVNLNSVLSGGADKRFFRKLCFKDIAAHDLLTLGALGIS